MTKDEALRLALEALENAEYGDYYKKELNEAITAIKEALAQPEQEPYCYTYTENGEEYFAPPTAYVPDNAKPLYTTPPQRTWVGLTDEDLEAEFGFIDELLRDTCYRTEAKLKAKNSL